ncbi:MAG: CHASE3 domain-containing protein, partial [Sulfuricurvum sp.]
MFRNLSLKQKILGGGLLPLLFVGLVNIIGLINFNGVVESYQWVSHTNHVTELGNDVETAALNMETGERGYVITGNSVFLEPYTQGSQDYHAIFKELKQITTDKESLDALDEAEKALNTWKGIADGYIQKRKELANSPHASDTLSNLVGQQKGKESFDAFRAQMKKFDSKEKELLSLRVKDAEAVAHTTNNVIIFGTLLALILAVSITIFIVKIITNPILAIKEAAMRISEGEMDVTINIDSRDELGQMGQAFTVMVNRLRDIATIAHKIGEGDFNVVISKHSDKDVLGNALENMVANLTNISGIAHKIGQGDLNVSVMKRSENDILGSALDNMLTNLNGIMLDLKEGTFALNSATNEILATTAQVSSGASQTFSAVSQTSASIEQIKQTAKVSSGKATQTAESTSKAMEIAKSGTDELNEN